MADEGTAVNPQQVGRQQLADVWRIVSTTLRPEPVVIYKPKQSGDGVAAKFNLRLKPNYADGEEYVKSVDGGLFVDLVAQGEKNTSGFPTFKWTERETLVTAKLGMADVSGLLAAIAAVRDRSREVPTYLRGKPATAKPNVVSLFHTTDSSGSTGITYTFQDEGSIFSVSKSKDLRRSVSLTLGEEVVLRKYLELALDAFIRVGL